jgi:hypothetical protein
MATKQVHPESPARLFFCAVAPPIWYECGDNYAMGLIIILTGAMKALLRKHPWDCLAHE